jgi:hypothetical protein
MYWKSTRFWWPLPNEPQNHRFIPLAVLTSGWVVPLGLFGLLACMSPFRLRALWPLHASIVIVAAVSSVTQGGTRERLVIEPILILFASDRIVAITRWGSRRAEAANAKEVGPDTTAPPTRSS